MTGEPALRVTGLTVTYGGVRALQSVSLTIGLGTVVGVIGPNGAGKSTLFDVVSGIQQPTSGQVLLRGMDITRRSPVWRARNGVRRTFQRPQLFGALTVRDNLRVALAHGGRGGLLADIVAPRRWGWRAEDRQIDGMLDTFGLGALGTRLAGELPVGQAKLVEVARALVAEPDVLLLDEPTAGLDNRQAEQLAEILDQVRSAGRCTVLLVEHDVGFVVARCARVIVLERGEVLADRASAELRNDPAVRAAYLGEGTWTDA